MTRRILFLLIVVVLAFYGRGSFRIERNDLVDREQSQTAVATTLVDSLDPQQPDSLDPQQPITDTDRADKLFDQRKWAEARSSYDQTTNASKVEIRRHVAERTVTCSLMLSDWDDALRRALEFKNSKSLLNSDRHYWPQDRNDLADLMRVISHFDFIHHLLDTIRKKSLADGPKPFQDRLAQEIISFNFELLRILDPDSVTRREKWGWESGYASMDWWWEGTLSALDEFDTDNRRSYWNSSDGIPVDHDGRPISLSTPVEYQDDLGRARKTLFLLDEIERLDTSESKRELARALLHRADVMRRIYGPNSDPAWQGAVFYYQYAQRPSFEKGRDDPSLKQLWELDDDEARSMVGQNLQVIPLPSSDSPLAIWRRIEESLSSSELAPEAIYQRGLYYQNRRQFFKAIGEYERLIKHYPNNDRAKNAKEQIGTINHADVLLGSTGVFAAGSQPSLWFACRNTKAVEFTAHPVDLKELLLDREKAGEWWELTYFGHNVFSHSEDNNQELAKFVGPESEHWSQAVPSSDQVSTHSTQVPLTKAGAYVVEARVPGAKQGSRGLIILSGVAIVQKPLPGKVLLWAVDSRTGQPLPNQQIQMVHKNKRQQWATSTTDQDGAIYYEPDNDQDTFALVATEQGDIAFCEIEDVGDSHFGQTENMPFGITDRSLYRPGSTVNFRVWIRELADRQFRPAAAGAKVCIKIEGPAGGQTVKSLELSTDVSGSVIGSFELDREAPLGEYRVSVDDPTDRFDDAACEFRVEEYKKPEFEVVVLPTRETMRPGEAIKAVIKANYYTGQPVSGAAVRYRIHRSHHLAQYEIPTKWDWLYGEGFGDYSYLYPWLGDSTMTMENDWSWSRSRYYFGGSPDELVNQGIGQLDENGAVEISIDTARFAKEINHRFTITAAVRDESRRTIEGSGSVIVSPQQYFAFTKVDRDWYQTGSEAIVDIDTRSVNNVPVSCVGNVSLYRITSVESTDGKIDFKKEIVDNSPVKTDDTGHAKLEFRLPAEGQYRLVFETHDGWKQPVTAESTIWVHGPQFDATKYKFGGLEIIPDKRTYQVGESAKLLINTAQANARLLIVDSMDNHRFVDIPKHSKVVEIPITAKHVPNFFFEGTLVHDGQVFNESCEIYVPPVDDLLTVEMRPDQQIYKPGQKGAVQIKVTDEKGNPVTGSMAITTYDKSLTYIQQESETGPKALLAARRTEYWSRGIEHTLGSRKFEISGSFTCPEFHLEDGSHPTAGGMGGSAPTGGDPSDTVGASQTSSRRAAIRDPMSQEELFAGQMIEPKIRTDFSDTAVWLPDLQLDKNGSAVGDITFPESLTTWRIHGYLVTPETRVGDTIFEVKTNKDLLVRLQSPRFFVESDQVVLSAIVHNNLPGEKDVATELIVPAILFGSFGENAAQSLVPDDQGNLHLIQRAKVQSGKPHRFDWPMQAKSSGLATITVKAQTDVESDAMQMAFPVNSRGIVETESHSGFFLTAETGNKEIQFEIPANIDPARTKIELTMAPSAAGAAFDALPFLAGYPYGCVEQTMSRFYPTVLVADTLTKLGTDLEAIAKNISERNQRGASRFSRSSVFDSLELRRMSDAGLNRLYRFQHEDGGWGWWEHDDSSPYMTAYVLLGLNSAADSGINVSESVFQSGVRYLIQTLDDPARDSDTSANRNSERALIAYVLSLKRSTKNEERRGEIGKLIDSLYLDLANSNPYGKALLALALHNQNMNDKATIVLDGILEKLESDEGLNASWIPTSKQDWSRWDNSDVETNAWVLRALVAIDSDNKSASGIVNWLVGHRHHGNYWRSTRDSALAVHALAEYLLITKQAKGDYKVAVHLDGNHVKDVQVSWQNMLEMESRLVLTGDMVKTGKHKITLVKENQGPLCFSLATEYLTKHDRILATGTNGLRIERHYYRIPAKSASVVDKSEPADLVEPSRTPLEFGESLSVGDTIEVELTISADDSYEFLAFEDPKPAGCEPIRLRSGYGWGDDGLCSNVEVRDSTVVFFVRRLPSGKQVLRYTLRAEVPGKYSAMPTQGFAMYTPEIHARSDEMQLQIRD